MEMNNQQLVIEWRRHLIIWQLARLNRLMMLGNDDDRRSFAWLTRPPTVMTFSSFDVCRLNNSVFKEKSIWIHAVRSSKWLTYIQSPSVSYCTIYRSCLLVFVGGFYYYICPLLMNEEGPSGCDTEKTPPRLNGPLRIDWIGLDGRQRGLFKLEPAYTISKLLLRPPFNSAHRIRRKIFFFFVPCYPKYFFSPAI